MTSDGLEQQEKIYGPAKRKNFTLSEDNALRFLVSKYGENDWTLISEILGTRNARQ